MRVQMPATPHTRWVIVGKLIALASVSLPVMGTILLLLMLVLRVKSVNIHQTSKASWHLERTTGIIEEAIL